MNITNHKLLKFRILSPIFATVFAVAVYAEVKEYFMFPFVFLQLASLVLAIKFKCKKNKKSLSVISKGGAIFLTILYVLAIAMGIMVAMKSANIAHSIAAACFYVVCLDAIMAIPFVLSFTEGSRWSSGYGTSDGGRVSGITPASGMPIIGCSDSGGTTPTLWPAGHHSNDIHIESPGVNPTTGLPMANGAVDVGGNLYGMNHDTYNSVTGSGYTDYSGSSYSSSMSDYSHDYNNDFGRNS